MQIFKDRVILITGANRGIGRSLVKTLLEHDVKKIYATYRDLKQMPSFNDDRVVPLPLDITNSSDIAKTIIDTSDTEILINNAGVLSSGTILEGDLNGMNYDMQVNYFGTINMMRAYSPILVKNRPARIINIVSIAAYSPLPTIAGYAASKAALFSATQSVRIELAKKGITVHAVNPGAIGTDMNKGSDWVMPTPDSVAIRILQQIALENLDIIPDEIGQNMYNAWKEDPSKLAKIFSDIYHM
ncbi:SDR family NAD(P)-dependent oxidoreductase [Sphingobacterium yanglingense]|uniref:Short-subunit dehydrogenase n=1 Tax=Sphingobacterium yanglingense TaxID=1437280 RepID=A0A4V3DEC4_9SPHI|nr:SDR family NAD(P)-dependent oxidoreductase [Sphingobacterium yanglingense]TDQ80179.1 short-subunit dehydrogenase [Sphingobacterium yanglingense]